MIFHHDTLQVIHITLTLTYKIFFYYYSFNKSIILLLMYIRRCFDTVFILMYLQWQVVNVFTKLLLSSSISHCWSVEKSKMNQWTKSWQESQTTKQSWNCQLVAHNSSGKKISLNNTMKYITFLLEVNTWNTFILT